MRISVAGEGRVYIYDGGKHIATVYRNDRKLALNMAAARELLHVARYALADLEGIMETYDPDRYHAGWITIQELRAVIAKATE